MAGKRGLAYHTRGDAADLPDNAPAEAVKIDFAKRLERAMNRKGWNQSELGRQAHMHSVKGNRVGRDDISNYVRAKNLPSPLKLEALAKALGVETTDLLPTRGVPSASDRAPAMDVRDMGDGNVWLRINQAVDRQTGLKIMNILMSE